MTIKQTQTKLFDFSDVGLDFCVGSKNLFPDRFKKMLALGYNVQTVSSVAVSGSQVTFTYGVSHGYAADRVLKVNSGALASINGGEFWIDSVTTNTLTITLDDAQISITGNFTTHVAPLGWSLEYENANIHVYKFKSLDETDLYIRLCFENNSTRRSCISPCIGKSFNPSTGLIDDLNALQSTASITSPEVFSWDFTDERNSTYNNYSYSQGYSNFGAAKVVGSKYHFLIASWQSQSTWRSSVNGFLPQTNQHPILNYPVLIGFRSANGTSTRSGYGQAYSYDMANATGYGDAWVGNHRVNFSNQKLSASNTKIVDTNVANSSFYPEEIENFNTTTAHNMSVYLASSLQFVGFVNGGMYQCRYSSSNTPPNTYHTSPSLTTDIDLSTSVVMHLMAEGTNSTAAYFAIPIEEIKIA